MNARTTARRGLALVAIAAAGLIALSGCKIGGGKEATGTPAAGTPTAQASASAKPSASTSGRPAGKPSGKPSGNANALPDVCTLLSRAEVSALAGGKQVAQVDPDDAKPGDTTRFCQWQLSGARLAVFLSPTTASEFSQAHTNSRAVSGLGDAAYFASGHLYVRQGTILVDVYASNGSEDASEKMARSTAAKVLPRL
jgi:hypothetical protein